MMPMQNQDDVARDARRDQDKVEETLVFLGQVWRTGRMSPQGRSYGWKWTRAKRCQGSHSHLPSKSSEGLVWWYQEWGAMREIWTHFLAAKGAGEGAAIAKGLLETLVSGQNLAKDDKMYDATVHAYFAFPKPKRGVFVFVKTRSFKRKDSLARLPPRRGNVLTIFEGDQGSNAAISQLI